MKQTPMIVQSPLSRPPRWFVLTRYQEKRGVDPKTGDDVSYLRALEKFDVTEQMETIFKRWRKSGSAKRTKSRKTAISVARKRAVTMPKN